MSEPATVLLARHGKASYVETWFSDEGGWLSPQGREQARVLARLVADRGITQVWSSDVSRAVQTAEVVAAALGLDAGDAVVARKSLREVFIGDLLGRPFDVGLLHQVTDRWFAGDLDARFPGGESGTEVVRRYGDQLAEAAASRPGGTVLTVVHQTAASIAIPTLCGGLDAVHGREHELANGEFAELRLTGERWTLASWGQDHHDAVPDLGP